MISAFAQPFVIPAEEQVRGRKPGATPRVAAILDAFEAWAAQQAKPVMFHWCEANYRRWGYVRVRSLYQSLKNAQKSKPHPRRAALLQKYAGLRNVN